MTLTAQFSCHARAFDVFIIVGQCYQHFTDNIILIYRQSIQQKQYRLCTDTYQQHDFVFGYTIGRIKINSNYDTMRNKACSQLSEQI